MKLTEHSKTIIRFGFGLILFILLFQIITENWKETHLIGTIGILTIIMVYIVELTHPKGKKEEEWKKKQKTK